MADKSKPVTDVNVEVGHKSPRVGNYCSEKNAESVLEVFDAGRAHCSVGVVHTR